MRERELTASHFGMQVENLDSLHWLSLQRRSIAVRRYHWKQNSWEVVPASWAINWSGKVLREFFNRDAIFEYIPGPRTEATENTEEREQM